LGINLIKNSNNDISYYLRFNCSTNPAIDEVYNTEIKTRINQIRTEDFDNSNRYINNGFIAL